MISIFGKTDEARLQWRHKRAGLHAGFTLIELMIAVAILAIVMGIAIPSYTQYVLKSGRAEAKTELLGAAQALERCFTRFSAYDADECAALRNDIDGRRSENEKFELSLDAVDGTSFTVTATPKGSQTNDTDCPNFGLDETGQRYIDGRKDAADLDECW